MTLAAVLVSASLPTLAKPVPQAASSTPQSGSTAGSSGMHATAGKPQAKKQLDQADEGNRIFEQNCSRCHNAPDGFSSHISGTVVRHMRVRANLSDHDEQELLRFFNP